jgi:hypothetical protein
MTQINKSNCFQKQSISNRPSAVSQILRLYHEQAEIGPNYFLNGFTFSVANKPNQLRSCFALAYNEYLKKGYVSQQLPQKMIISEHDKDKKTLVVMAKNEYQEIVGTLSIVIDGEKGLPCHELFPEELNRLRQKGAKVAEVIRLAISEDHKNSKEILLGMFNLVCNYIKNVAGCSDLVIEVNPRHVKYYQRLLLFNVISEEKECIRVEGAPAVLLCLNKTDVEYYYQAKSHDKEFLRSLHPHLSKGIEEVFLTKMIQTEMLKITKDILEKSGIIFQNHHQLV